MPRSGRRTGHEQAVHDRAIELIARQRYSFTDKITYRNPGERRTMSAGRVGGKDQYPDIVVVSRLRKALLICEVETESSVTEEEADQWQDYASLGVPFYLYVPSSKVVEAESLIHARGLSGAIRGLRAYSLGRADITIEDVWDGQAQ